MSHGQFRPPLFVNHCLVRILAESFLYNLWDPVVFQFILFSSFHSAPDRKSRTLKNNVVQSGEARE